MVDEVTIQVDGLRELEAAALELGAKVGAQALRRALVKSSEPVLRQMRARAPVDEGTLRQSIGLRSRAGTGRSSTVAKITIGPLRRVRGQSVNARAIAVEFGTRSQAAQPFIRPALADNVGKVLRSFRLLAWAEISSVKARGDEARK